MIKLEQHGTKCRGKLDHHFMGQQIHKNFQNITIEISLRSAKAAVT